jgi:hypothetical protein
MSLEGSRCGKPCRSTIALIFGPFPRLVGPISAPPPLAIDCEGRIDKALLFVQHALLAKLVGNICQHTTQNFIATPRALMHRFVV